MRVSCIPKWLPVTAFLAFFAASAGAADLSPEQAEFFESKVRPVLADNCYACHSGASEILKGDFRLDFREGLLKGGKSGQPAIVPGNPESSPLVSAIKRANPSAAMPPKAEKKLTPDQVAALEAWIRMGAPDPRTVAPVVLNDPATKAKNHWAFKKPIDSPVPAVKNAAWAKADLDRFILAKLESKNLQPAAPADKVTLIRRATFDLTGLPPTPDEVQAFSNDNSADAFAKVVDRLLASPRYGERWGRYWLDVARYADTKGYVFEEERRYPYSYTYRDWVIRSLNADLPYDQFLINQIAADRLPGDDKSNQAALGFLTVGRRFLNNQADIMDDRIDVVTRGTMGLTVQCARCHDHKFDPIPTKDYYSLYGIFASSPESRNPPVVAVSEIGPDAKAYAEEFARRSAAVQKFLDDKRAELTKELVTPKSIADYLSALYDLRRGQGDRKGIAADHDVRRGLLDRWGNVVNGRDEKHGVLWLLYDFMKLSPEEFEAKAPSVVERIGKDEKRPLNPLVSEAFAGKPAPKSFDEVADRYAKLLSAADGADPLPEKGREMLRQVLRGPGGVAVMISDDIPSVLRRDEQNQFRDVRKKVDELNATHPGAPPRAMAVEDSPQPMQPHVFVRGNPGNQGDAVPRQFLGILAGPDRKPFTDGSGRLELARAIASKENPLTARVMVNRVWRDHFGAGLVTTPSDFGLRSDPPTHPEMLDWLAVRFMNDGWSLKKLHRLIMLSATYQQDSVGNSANAAVDPENRLLWRMNRRRLDFEAMRDSLLAVTNKLDFSMGGKGVELTAEPSPKRRSVYGFIERQNLPGLFRTFDFASPDTTSPQRFFTTVPQQALFMMNSPFIVRTARELAGRPDVSAEADAAKRVEKLYRIVFGRAPSADDIALGKAFVESEGNDSVPVSPWAYGYGRYDAAKQRVAKFSKLSAFVNNNWQGGPKMPDKKLGWVTLGAGGGHPGTGDDFNAIRRFTVPADGKLTIDGRLNHAEMPGNGVRARIVSSRAGELASWSVHNTEAQTRIDNVEVKAGDTIDFVVDDRGDTGWDSFAWAPVIRLTRPQLATAAGNEGVTEYNAATSFAGPEIPAGSKLSAWEKYAQVLLESNEFAFVD